MIKLKAIAECSIRLEKGHLDGSSEILFGILAHLIVERGRSVPRSTLAEYFWWNSEPREAGHCLRQSVYKLRQMGAPIETTREHYVVGERAALADFDCADERTLALSPLPPEEAVAVFPRYAPNASAPFLTWLERTREKAGRSIRGVLVRALGDARRRNSWDEAAKLARQCLVLDPLNEEATLTLAEFTALRGDKREALRMIDGYIEEMGGTYADLRLPASLLRNRISERISYPPASAAGKVALVGREDSLEVLANVAAQVTGGVGHTCVIHGPPGIGKTRLLTEFANISAMKGARIVRVECHADAIERPLALFMELAPQLLRMPGALGCSPEALKLVKRLGSYDPNEQLDPDEYGGAAFLHAAMRASLRDLIDAIAGERPLYLLIEDVHWIDRVSLEVLKEIIGSNRARQLLVVMTARTLGDGTLLEGIDRRQLVVHDLPRLGAEKSRALALSLCAALGISDEDGLAEWCTRRSDGIPLYMTELLSHWRETKDRSRVPVSLDALIDERVGALDKAALFAMQAIALMEGDATVGVLESVLGMQRWQVIGCVEELEKSGLVVCTAERIAARHSLLSDAALQKMGPSAALMLHRAIAAYLAEEIERGATDPNLAWQAASHWSAGGATDTALELVIKTARHMASIGAVFEASRLLEQALTLCTADAQILRMLNERRPYLEACGDRGELQRNCGWAMRLEASEIGSSAPIHSANELAYLSSHVDGRKVDGVVKQALLCIESTTASIEHRLAAAAMAMMAAYAESNSQLADTIAQAGSRVRPRTDSELLNSLRLRMIYEYEFGNIDRAVEASDAFLEVYRRAGRKRISRAMRISSYAHRLAGNFAVAAERTEQALTIARQQLHPLDESQALEALAILAAENADYEAAARLLRELVDAIDRCPPVAELATRVSMARVALTLGDDELALSQLSFFNGLALTLHGRCDVLAAKVFSDVVASKPVDEVDLADLIALNDRLRERPGQEAATISIATALNALGRTHEAVAIVTSYVSGSRREPWPSRNPLLAAFLNEIDDVDPALRRALLRGRTHKLQ